LGFDDAAFYTEQAHMTYRKPAPMPPEPPRETSKLEQLKSRGRSINAERAAEEETERAEQRQAEAQQTRIHLQESMVRSSREFQTYGGLSMLLFVLPGLAGILFGVFLSERSSLVIPGIAASVPGLVSLFWGRRYFGARAVARERAFIKNLTFSVEGYEEVLSRAPSNGTLTLHIKFAGPGPENAEMVDLGGLLKAEVEPLGHKRFTFKSPDLSCDQGDGPSSNHDFHVWLRQAFDEVLLPLHREHLLKSVKVTRS
jgi:hypothetical protein